MESSVCSFSNQNGYTTFLTTSEALDWQNQRAVHWGDKPKSEVHWNANANSQPLNYISLNYPGPLTDFLQYTTASVFYLPYDFLSKISVSLAYLIIRIEYINTKTYKICINYVYVIGKASDEQ